MEKMHSKMIEEKFIMEEFENFFQMFGQINFHFCQSIEKFKSMVNYCKEGVQNFTILSKNFINEVVHLEEKLESKDKGCIKDKSAFLKSAANLESILIQQIIKEKSPFRDESQLQFLKLRVQNQIKETLQAKGVYMVSHADKNYIGDYVEKDIEKLRTDIRDCQDSIKCEISRSLNQINSHYKNAFKTIYSQFAIEENGEKDNPETNILGTQPSSENLSEGLERDEKRRRICLKRQKTEDYRENQRSLTMSLSLMMDSLQIDYYSSFSTKYLAHYYKIDSILQIFATKEFEKRKIDEGLLELKKEFLKAVEKHVFFEDSEEIPTLSLNQEEIPKAKEIISFMVQLKKGIVPSNKDLIKVCLICEERYFWRLFLKVINYFRINNQKKFPSPVLYSLSKVFAELLDNCTKNCDLGSCLTIFMLSMTFFYENERDEKVFIFDYIKSKQIWGQRQFWIATFIKELVNFPESEEGLEEMIFENLLINLGYNLIVSGQNLETRRHIITSICNWAHYPEKSVKKLMKSIENLSHDMKTKTKSTFIPQKRLSNIAFYRSKTEVMNEEKKSGFIKGCKYL